MVDATRPADTDTCWHTKEEYNLSGKSVWFLAVPVAEHGHYNPCSNFANRAAVRSAGHTRILGDHAVAACGTKLSPSTCSRVALWPTLCL